MSGHLGAAPVTVRSCEVIRSSGHPILDRAAVRAVRGWRFREGPGRARLRDAEEPFPAV